jgi:hypothetical protein
MPFDDMAFMVLRTVTSPGVLHRWWAGLKMGCASLVIFGGSSSVCAIKNGVSVDTSMGFPPQSGFAERSVTEISDPFILLYMMDKEGLNTEQIVPGLSRMGVPRVFWVERRCS